MLEDYSPELNASTAHMDHGWELLNQGKLSAARISAGQILEIDPDSPDGYTLLGAISAAEGDPDEAMIQLRQAIDLDPEHLDAIMYSAELALLMLKDWDTALALCLEAEPLVEDDQDRLDLILLRAEALRGVGDLEGESLVIDQIPPPPYRDGSSNIKIGRVLLDAGRLSQAVEVIGPTLNSEELGAEAHYLMGAAREYQGRLLSAAAHFHEVWCLDRAEESPPWAPPEDELCRVARQALEGHPSAGRLADDVQIEVRPAPPLELVSEGYDPRGMIFIGGMAPPAPRGEGGDRGAPDAALPVVVCIFIYARNLERQASSRVDLFRLLAEVLKEEVLRFYEGDPAEPDEWR